MVIYPNVFTSFIQSSSRARMGRIRSTGHSKEYYQSDNGRRFESSVLTRESELYVSIVILYIMSEFACTKKIS